MPLLPGSKNIGSNIKELMHTGKYPHKQAIAIAESNARRHPRFLGGANMPSMSPIPPNRISNIPQFAGGGSTHSVNHENGDPVHAGGLFPGTDGGRADTLKLSVPSDSHVIPADVTSSVGGGNTNSGGKFLDQMFHGGLTREHLAHGGIPQFEPKKHVPIMASSGEFNVNPSGVYRKGLEQAKKLKKNTTKMTKRQIMDLGHDWIDKWIVENRKKEIEAAKKRPAPRKN